MTTAQSIQLRPATGTSIRAFGALCRRLDPGWRAVRNRCVKAGGEQYLIHFILVHPDYGIGLIVFLPEDYVLPEMALRITRNMLRDSGFERRFGHSVPLVFVALDPDNCQNAPAQLGQAFSSAPANPIKDPTWVEWVMDRFDRTPAFDDEVATTNEHGTSRTTADDMSTTRRARARSWVLAASATFAAATLVPCGVIAYAYMSPASVVSLGGGSLMIRVADFGGRSAQEQGAREPSRLMSEEQIAQYLGLKVDAFRARQVVLRDNGFPQAETVTGNYDKAAVDRWLDGRSRAQ